MKNVFIILENKRIGKFIGPNIVSCVRATNSNILSENWYVSCLYNWRQSIMWLVIFFMEGK